jgi:hypothetical protein
MVVHHPRRVAASSLELFGRDEAAPWGHLEGNDFSRHFDEFCV